MRVAVIGIGQINNAPVTAHMSYREIEYEAAKRAYQDAGISHKDVDSFVSCIEDLNEGISIADEYTPDQVGAYMKPMCTVSADGIHGVIDGMLRIYSGVSRSVLIVSHSKASNIVNHFEVLNYALDPIFTRPLSINCVSIAALEAQRYMHEAKVSEDDLAAVVIKNRANALFNENGCYGATLSNEDIANSSVVASPIRVLDIAHYADTAMCLILAEESFIKEKKIKSQPVWVNGFGFCNGSNTLESREWVQPKEASLASQKALKMAGLKNKDIDFVEISDTYSYKELQLLETAGFCKFGSAKSDLKKGKFDIGGALPVNASGGELGNGTLLEATGLFKVTELVKQLRGHAGRRQLPKKVSNGFALGWRDIPTTSYAAIVMGNKK